jgi:hypothetical protein
MSEPHPSEGAARELGKCWKCSPRKRITELGEVYVFTNIDGPGAIQSNWTAACIARDAILRV